MLQLRSLHPELDAGRNGLHAARQDRLRAETRKALQPSPGSHGNACWPVGGVEFSEERALALSGVCKRAASSHTSSLCGHASVPFIAKARAAAIFPCGGSEGAGSDR